VFHLVKRYSILLVFFTLYLVVVALVLLELDKQYYQVAKKDYITENADTCLLDRKTRFEIGVLAEAALRPATQARATQQLIPRIHQILTDDANSIYSVILREERPDGSTANRIELSGEEKFRRNNTWDTSLFMRYFTQHTRQTLEGGQLEWRYTNPIDNRQLQELTIRYRWYAAFIVLILTLLAAALARSLLIPLNNVLTSLESSTQERTVFSRRPRSRLESLYNRMAIGAVISRLQSRLREEIARNPQLTGWEIVGFVCRAFGEQADLPLVACLEMVTKGPGAIHATGRHVFAGRRLAEIATDRAAESIDQAMPRDGRDQINFELDDLNPPLTGELLMLSDPHRSGFRYLCAVLLESRDFESPGKSLEILLQGLNDLIDTGLQSLSLRNQLVVKERGRANISLSRNLGHDLTNIIATSKLDLMALERLLRKGEMPDDPRRQGILRESFQGLLKSIRFMQETVNLYRSYAFLQHPVLEIHDGNALIADTLDLFTLSIGSKIEIHRELADDAPRCVVDPRLIKLALFNMFSNSLKAIRHSDPELYAASGWIKVITRRTLEDGLCVAVEDSGSGIVDAAGRKMERHEIEKIFDLGYTSGDDGDDGGEGLGLNWVRTIIQDLHGGSILAENTENAGARFVIVFPPLEQAPDMANAERKAKDYMAQFQRQRAARGENAAPAEIVTSSSDSSQTES
jgi:signal transduction histidine kinase